jgi:hypothetical protein
MNGNYSTSLKKESATGRPDRDPLATQDDPAKFLTQDNRDRVGRFLAGGGLETGEPVHSNHFDAVAPGRVSLAEPGLEHLLRSALDHIQQPRRTGTVPDRRQVDDHGDVRIAAAGVAPAVLVDADHAHTVEPVWVLDQHTPALGQHRVVRGVPRHAEALGDPSDGQVLTHDAF